MMSFSADALQFGHCEHFLTDLTELFTAAVVCFYVTTHKPLTNNVPKTPASPSWCIYGKMLAKAAPSTLKCLAIY